MDTEGRRRGDALPLPRDPPRSPRPPGGRPDGPGGPAPGPPLLLGAGGPRQAAGAAGKELRRDSGGGRAPGSTRASLPANCPGGRGVVPGAREA